jgi:hypothetical protein
LSIFPFHRKLVKYGLLGGLLLTAVGCNDEHSKASGGSEQSSNLHAQYDRDSRNNEDNTLGVKSKYLNEQRGEKPANPGAFQQLDMNNMHLSKTFRFAPEISSRLERHQGIQGVTVMLTEHNAYVAVITDGHNPDKESHPDMMTNSITSKGGVGLFGTDKGSARINWGDMGGLSTMMAAQMKSEIIAMSIPQLQRVFVSANPNFVQRVRFYEKEGQRGVDTSVYLNEFNTMIQRVFPSDHNTRR